MKKTLMILLSLVLTAALTPEGVPQYVLETLAGYYLANKPGDNDWVVLPVTNFDAYFGNTSFSRKWLAMIPESFMLREKQNFGVCRYRVIYKKTEE